jgi:ATP-dependent helicase/nuclease subunit A
MSDHTTRTQASADELDATDALAREHALDIAASWLVQAPAGSGKTELLVQRMLALLAHVERPERVVATTFTRKAAAEMRARIVAALADAAAGVAVDTPHRARTRELAQRVLAQDRARGWRLLEFPGRLDVGTLDALAQRIAAQHPVASALGGAPRPSEGAAATALYRLAAQRAIAAAPPHDRVWRTLIEHFDNDADRVAELLVTMLARRDQWLPPLYALRDPATRAALEQTLVEEIEAELADVAQRWPGASVQGLVALAHEVRQAVADAAAQDATKAPLGALLDTLCRDGALPPASCAALAHWRTLVGWVLTDAGTFRKSTLAGFAAIGKGEGVTERRAALVPVVAWLRDATAIDGLETALQRLRHLPPDPRYSPRARAFIDALLELLPQAAAMLDVVFAEEGRSDFAEVTRRALATLGEADDPSPILLAQDLRIEHLLVDEFQDTSRRQLAFIERLTSGWQPGDGRTLFAVGDPMQSIYGFRDADVRNFLVAAREGRIGGVALGTLRLARNFRAVAELVDHVNATFPRVLARVATRSTEAVTFGAALPTQPADDGAATLEWAVDADDEAARVVARARDALAAGCEDVAILVRARRQAATILPALRAAGISYDAVKLESLAERPQSRDLLWLARALTQPADLLAWLVVLRAPWCGLVLADLLAFADAARSAPPQRLLHDRACDAALTPDGAARLQRVAAIFASVERARAAPLVARVRAAWFALGGPVAYGKDSSNTVAADAMLTLLAAHDRGGDIDDWDALQDEAAALLADPPVAAGARVKVMTLHGAKGLEFDAVVLPGLDRPLKRDGPALLHAHGRQRAHGRHAARTRRGRRRSDRRLARQARRRGAHCRGGATSLRRLYARQAAAACGRQRSRQARRCGRDALGGTRQRLAAGTPVAAHRRER